MGDGEIPRRRILATLAGAGGIGTAVGTGTAAFVTDGSVFSGSTMSTGRLALSVAWSTGNDSGSSQGSVAIPLDLTSGRPTTTVDLTVSLPDRKNNNPAYGWIRSRCPNDGELLQYLDVSIRYADCQRYCEIFSGSLSTLADGVPLNGSVGSHSRSQGQQCLQPGEDLDLELEVGIAGFEGRDSASFGLEFVGTQCRNDDRPSAPFDSDGDCSSSVGESGRAISYVAFCTASDGPIGPELDVTTDGDDGPLAADWRTDVDVDLVAVKAGTALTVYDVRAESARSGAVRPGDPEAAISALDLEPGDSATPCAVAASALGADPADFATSAKLEYENGDWVGDEG